MRTKDIKTDNQVDLTESEKGALILAKLRGRLLFPEKIESAKKYLKHINKNARV